jgi:hypothetical protein
MDATIPPDSNEPPMIREDEIERLLAIEIACECLLAHAERVECATAEAQRELRAA